MQNDSFHSVQHWPYEVFIHLFIYYLCLIHSKIRCTFSDPFVLIFSSYAFLLSIWEFNFSVQRPSSKVFALDCTEKKKMQARSDMPTMINILTVSSNLISVVKQLITKSEKQKGVISFACSGDSYSYPQCLLLESFTNSLSQSIAVGVHVLPIIYSGF